MQLDPDETLFVDGRALRAFSPALRVEPVRTGAAQSLLRRAHGGSFRLRRLVATAPGQRVELRPTHGGDIEHIALDGELSIDRASLLAFTPGIEITSELAGPARVLTGGAPLRLQCTGRGELWLHCRDPVLCLEVDGTHVLHGAHLLAHDATLVPTVHVLGGARSLVASGEGRTLELLGRGRVWLRTRISPRW